jgi:hypothetical protein
MMTWACEQHGPTFMPILGTSLYVSLYCISDTIQLQQIVAGWVLSSGLFPDVCSLNANVLEHCVCFIFIGK